MSVRRGQRPAGPGIHLSWLLCCSALLSSAAGYVIVSSVSWAVTNEVDEELDSASTEEAMPALLEDSGSIWQRRFPASAHKEDAHLPPPAGTARARPSPAPPGMFSYRRESGRRLRPSTARFLAHVSAWGCLATVSAHEKIPGLPFGNCVPISDGPLNNSTGIPYFYVTPKDPVVANLMKNSMASLLLPESEGEFCRKNIVDPEDPRCARLTLTGQMTAVSPEEVEFAKQAMFSRFVCAVKSVCPEIYYTKKQRHPVMRKWPRQYEWFFMKMRIEHIWLQKWYGGVSDISREEYFKAVPRKA